MLRDADGCLPLHLASECAAGGVSSDHDCVIRLLLGCHPDVVNDVDLGDMLPLHHATLYGAPVSVVRQLVEASEDAAAHESRESWTPLNLALIYGR